MLHQGKLKDWNPTQGKGFIQRDKAGPDIRISSSGFRKKPEKLQDGDSIFFRLKSTPRANPKLYQRTKQVSILHRHQS